MSPKTDTEIWQAVCDGDSGAWKELIGRYQALVYAVATRGGLSMADAADCFQQTWVSLYEHRKELRDPSRLSAWLVTTAKREVLKIRQGRARETGLESLDSLEHSGLLPDEELEQLERQHQLERALALLDERCRKLLEALFFDRESRSYQEIAGDLGIAFNSLGPIRARCLERLKKILLEKTSADVRIDSPSAL